MNAYVNIFWLHNNHFICLFLFVIYSYFLLLAYILICYLISRIGGVLKHNCHPMCSLSDSLY